MAVNRYIVYTLKDGREEWVQVFGVRQERDERAAAERELRSHGTLVQSYRGEWREEAKDGVEMDEE